MSTFPPEIAAHKAPHHRVIECDGRLFAAEPLPRLPQKSVRHHERNRERNREIRALRASGLSLKEIGERYGITKQAVHTALK